MRNIIQHKIKLSAIVFVVITTTFLACKKSNINPNNATYDNLLTDNLLTGSFIVQMQQNVITTDINAFQVADNLIGDVFSGYMGASGNWFSSRNNTTYSLISDWNNEAFSRTFTKVMPAWKSVLENANPADVSVPAVATIIKVAAAHRTADIYGPLPYKTFLDKGTNKAYQSQQAVYTTFFAELDAAISDLTDFITKNPGAKPLAKFDLVYGGDCIKWIKFANSLKLRLAMRIVYADPTNAKIYAESAVNHPIGLISNIEEIAQLKSNNQILINNPLKYIWNDYADIRMGASMYSYLVGYNDPRISKYFSLSTAAGYTDKYLAIRAGSQIDDKGKYITFSTPNIQLNTPIQWMNAAEVSFLRAEGATRGWNMNGTAKDLYEKGISQSFEQTGAGNATTYMNDDVLKPVNYTDPVNSSNNSSARSAITIKWDETALFENKLERIITQKWLATYPNGQEAWSEFRRTRFPEIFTVVNNYSGGLINTAAQIRRIPFPNIEYQTNGPAVNQAVSLLGGPDNGATKLWWDKRP
jgi:hypothetical protein